MDVGDNSLKQSNITGKIKSVYCKHFVTYEECSFYPTEFLNVIIGPNGTGKSTLVAAIVLGLGGDPKLLSRSHSVKDYIKNGRTTATIHVEIHANEHGKAIVFQRSFDETGKSEYRVNEDVISKSKFLAAVAVFKIQISNLCQFLPQDRVQDFAKMNPQEILLNTISSVCSQDVINNFNNLKTLRSQQLDGQKTRTNNMLKLQESMIREEELNQILQRYNTRKEYLEKLDVCKAKKLWLEVDEIKVKTEEYAKDKSNAYKALKDHIKNYEDIKQKQSDISRITSKLNEDARKKEYTADKFLESKNDMAIKIEDIKKKNREAKTKFEKEKRNWFDRQNDLQSEVRMLDLLVQDLQNTKAGIGSISERNESLKKYQMEIEYLKVNISKQIQIHTDINKKLDEEYIAEVQMLRKRIERSQNIAEQKLQLLRNNFPDLYSAVQWLRENNNIFTGKIYNPMLLELNVRDPSHAKYFENTIKIRDLLAFTCENKSDVSLFVNEVCIKLNLAVNVSHSPPADECVYTSNEPIDNLRKFGFTSYLIDLIEGPPALLNSLCSLYKLHNIPIGTEQVNKCTDAIPKTLRFYFAGDQRYTVSISNYSKEPSLMQSRISGKQLLSSLDVNEIQTLQKRLNELLKKTDTLKNERSSVEAKINEIEVKRTELLNKKRAVEAKSSRFEQLCEQIKRQEIKVKKLKENIVSVPEMEKIFKKTAQHYLNNLLELHIQNIEILKSFEKAYIDKRVALTRINIYKQQNEELTSAINEANERKDQAQKLVDTITYALDTSKIKYNRKIEEAKCLTNNMKPSDINFPFKDLFNQLSNNLDELKESINEYSARLDCLADVDQEIVSEYETRRNEVELLKRTIEESLHGENNIFEEINCIYNDWYSEICRIVETLNTHFSDFMKSMSYVGEVLLVKQSEHDFDSYGIQILVQYRSNVPLQALDRHVQSGGERAVAIAVYTLSLQHLTHVPFRCVDEINQGMDSRNERKIFEMLVNETTQPDRAQYFFVTPKLLPNLTYNERMTVHVVFNGKIVQPNNAFEFQM